MLASWDSDLRCRFANRAYLNWFGVESSRMRGTSIRELLGSTLFELNEPYMRRALAGEEQVFERLIQCPDGIARHSLARYTPEVVGGVVVGFFAEVTDVTRTKTAEFELQHQIDGMGVRSNHRTELQARTFQQKRGIVEERRWVPRTEFNPDTVRERKFLAQLVHQMRQALIPIKQGGVLLGGGSKNPGRSVEEVGRMMLRQVSQLSRLMDDVSDFAGTRLFGLSIAPRSIDLRDVIREALIVCRPVFEEAEHKVRLAGFENALRVDGDPARLLQVFNNLLHNAGKYTPRRGRISLSATLQGATVQVAVRDNGIGMAPGTADSAFDMFSRPAEAVDLVCGGLGIGLALVRQIVEAHGGTVSARSEGRGRGSTFNVCLPLGAAGGRELPGGSEDSLRKPVESSPR